MDRANLGNAKTDSIEKDLHLVGNQFNLILVLFYIPYAIFNIPWVIGAKRFNPAIVIPTAIAIWGICTLASVAARSFGHLMACRIIMGAAEAAYKPCEMYYLSLFYTRREIALRVSWIGQMGFIAGAVSGLISYSVFQWKGGLHVRLQQEAGRSRAERILKLLTGNHFCDQNRAGNICSSSKVRSRLA